MKTECSLQQIKDAVAKTEKITSKNINLPALSSILILAEKNSLKFRATNLNLGIEVEIPAKTTETGSIVIRGDVLSSIFSNLPGEGAVILEQTGKNLSVSAKNNKILIKSETNDDFPTIPAVEGESFILPAKKFLEGIKSVYYAAAVSDIKPEISSVYFYKDGDELVFVATDSFRLAEKKIKTKNLSDIHGVLVPFKNITDIIRLFGDIDLDLNISVGKNLISFSHNGVYLTSRIIDGIFPDYKQIMPKEKQTEAVILKQDLLSALKIANIFSDKFNQVNIAIDPSVKKFELNSQNQDVGENKTILAAALSGEPLLIGFNYKYLLDALQSIGQDSLVLSFNQTSKPMVVNGVGDKSFTYLIMPMNR